MSLAIFIAGAYPAVSSALGLGDIESNSHLNQPLRATIDLLSTAPADASQIRVRLAPPDVFNRVGVARPEFLSNLHFTPTIQGGKPVILVTSDSPIQEPFVNFLLEVSWPQGQLLKEYTVMLDPPVLMQPGNTVAGEASVRAEPRATGNVRRPSGRQVAAAPASQSAANANRNRTYRVKSGDTLFGVASRLRQPGVNNDQMMMALFRANPNAFIDKNINNLRAGATLKAPPAGDVGIVSRAEARRQIREQNAEWREFRKALAGNTVPQQSSGTKAATKPATPAAKPQTQTASSAQDKARLEVLGAQSGGSAKDAAVAASSAKLAEIEKQLALANESLAARQKENTELKSRVTDLESMLGKKNRLLELRDNQLAELQKQLAATGIKTPDLAGEPTGQGAGGQQTAVGQMPVGAGQPAATQTPDQGKDIQTHMANVAGQNNDAVLRGEQPASTPVRKPPAAAVGEAPDAGSPAQSNAATQPVPVTPPVQPVNEPVPASSSLIPLKPPVAPTPPKPAVVPVTPVNPADQKPAPVFADQTQEGNDLLGLLTSPLALKIGAGSLALLLLLWLLGRRRKPESAVSNKSDERFANLDDDLEMTADERESMDLDSLESELSKAENRGGSHAHGIADHDPFGLGDDDDHVWGTDDRQPAATPAHIASTPEPEGEDDLLTEANVYIAYGLYQQAESELKKGIERDPDKLEYRHKLLECYFAANNREAFDQQAQQFVSMKGPNKEALWKSIAEWGRKISPDNKLYLGDGSSGGFSSVAATVATALGGATAAGAATVAAADDDATTQVARQMPTEARPADPYHYDSHVDTPADDDFGDLELGELDFDDIDLDKLLQEGEENDAERAEAFRQPAAMPELPDLDMGLEPDGHQKLRQGVAAQDAGSSEPMASLEEETFELEDLDDDLDLDFDLGLPEEPSMPVAKVGTPKADNAPVSAEDDLPDFDFDDEHDSKVEEGSAPAAMEAPAMAAASTSNATHLNLHLDNNTGINRILPKDTFYAPISEEDKDWLGDIDDALSFLDFPDEEIDLHEAHISTKLDLARAYLDMGDIEGARSTLEEVMVEGNDDQRREAEVLLHQTG
ncbi:MAG: FimV/HubP family polar landmark protein [Thiothrix sp.]